MQFPSSTQVRAEQRGQQPYVADSKAALSEQMLECSPPQLQLKGSDMTQVINLAKGISQFGMSLTPFHAWCRGPWKDMDSAPLVSSGKVPAKCLRCTGCM